MRPTLSVAKGFRVQGSGFRVQGSGFRVHKVGAITQNLIGRVAEVTSALDAPRSARIVILPLPKPAALTAT